MGEAQYDQLLDAVDAAMKHAPAPHLAGEDDDFMLLPVAANDNDGAWPHFPFPEGWTASC